MKTSQLFQTGCAFKAGLFKNPALIGGGPEGVKKPQHWPKLGPGGVKKPLHRPKLGSGGAKKPLDRPKLNPEGVKKPLHRPNIGPSWADVEAS